ncbi:MAG: PEP-CTERM sorting domain-containing protein [Minwuiales bacterium]|nr:PEP-CTERM sorting domain-containing protein [Minwuiales bacterium]
MRKFLAIATVLAGAVAMPTGAANAGLIISPETSSQAIPDYNNVLPSGLTMLFGVNLSVDGPSKVTYEYVGKEAGFENIFNTPFGSFNTKTASPGDSFMGNVLAGLLDFSFMVIDLATSVANGANNVFETPPNFGVVTSGGGLAPNEVYIALDDGGSITGIGGVPDDNHDDMVIKLTVEPLKDVPAPGALGLLGFGLLAFGCYRRRLKTA